MGTRLVGQSQSEARPRRRGVRAHRTLPQTCGFPGVSVKHPCSQGIGQEPELAPGGRRPRAALPWVPGEPPRTDGPLPHGTLAPLCESPVMF